MDRLAIDPITLRAVPFKTLLKFVLALIVTGAVFVVAGTNSPAQGFLLKSTSVAACQAGSPSDAVREFYKLMREKKFREAFALSIYQPAIEGLKPAEFDDLRPDFERLAAAIPEKVDISGEQISTETATVFVKVKDDDNKEQAEPVTLILVNGKWIVGDRENQEIVKKAGNAFFFNARIDTHHIDVRDMLQRISLAQVVYSQQHAGKFGDLAALILAGLVPKDLEGTETTGYRFRIAVSPDGKNWSASAEPAQYGRTGRLSFVMDQSGVRNGDVAGKPLPATPLKN
ncbi:MAG: DUF4878 domain-containing protein [Pyrinomonadaceae bacterium]|nr:DUF4878 domain-containing protein [Pyrinomonadaceae bacterium]